jgi:hypothetical protein
VQKTCAQCTASFEITEDDTSFYAEIGVPPPSMCPDCRSRLRCSHRNERSLSKRSCSLCKKDIVAMYRPNVPFPVYCPDCFFSDRWDPLTFGREFREGVPFMDQYRELLAAVPRLSIMNKQTENSEYTNYSYANRNCYLTFGSHGEEDCLYDSYSTKNKNCVDCLWNYGSELLYECLFSKNCYHSIFLDWCADCRDCAFSRDLAGCSDCLFCVNLRQKRFHIFNKPLSETEYRATLRSYRLETWKGLCKAREIFEKELATRFPVRAFLQTRCERCSGGTLAGCKSMRDCFFCTASEDCAYAVQTDNTVDSMDVDYMGYDRSERCYQTIGCQGLHDCIACNACWHGSGLRDCQYCFSCNDCIGCVSLQQKKFCILNREYAKEDYERLSMKIKESMTRDGSWGEFFPATLTPFAYNESMATDWFRLTEKEAKKSGYRWKTGDEMPAVTKVIRAADLPERIDDIPDDVLNWAIRCKTTRRPYRIVKQELDFYRLMRLPLPRHHPEERHRLRIARRHPRKLWPRSCAKCGTQIQTTYAPDRPEIVYCENCYLKEVY